LTVAEPTVANNGKQIFFTGNLFAAQSLDGGATWDFLNPRTIGAHPLRARFDGDQIAIYDPSRDLTIWAQLYDPRVGTGGIRLAVGSGLNLGTSSWVTYDFEPQNIPGLNGLWPDRPSLALSNDFVYLTAELFRVATQDWAQSIIFRVPIDDLAAGQNTVANFFNTAQFGALHCVQGARTTMHFAANRRPASASARGEVRVWSWPENANQVQSISTFVRPWGAAQTLTAGGSWLGRLSTPNGYDDRICAAWLASGTLGFMWNANNDVFYPHPYVRVVRLREDNKTLIDEPDIWNPNLVFAYPACSPNDRGQIGLTLFYSDPSGPPRHAVGILDDFSPTWRLQGTRDSTNAPSNQFWGDYLACRRHSPDGLTWLASGFTLQNGGSDADVEPLLVHFGRRGDAAAVQRWRNA